MKCSHMELFKITCDNPQVVTSYSFGTVSNNAIHLINKTKWTVCVLNVEQMELDLFINQ